MLKLVRIKNFKNLKRFVLTVYPYHTEFVARNSFGKTAIADAISWVMTGKLYNGSSDIMAIKPKDNPSALVSVELVFDDGTTIMKTYQDSTDCYINGIAIPVTKFDEELKKLFNIKYDGHWKGNVFQLLINPTFFLTKLEWQERKTIIMDLFENVTVNNVFNYIKFQLAQENSFDEKIRLGLKICEAIKKRLGITGLFYIIDNAEQLTDQSFTELTNDQIISFVRYEPKKESRSQKHEPTRKPGPLNLFDI